MTTLRVRALLINTIAIASVTLVACVSVDAEGPSAAESGSLAGTWTASSGEVITFSDDGPCENAFYSNGKPLDIGGPMTCHLSSNADSSGRYQLIVRQGPNQMTYLVQFTGDDAASVYTKNGEMIYTATRF